jgi:dolichol-phosphate mannosyltransferase
MRIWITLPAYNEADNLPAIFEGLQRVARDSYNLEIRALVVDDGSTDGTAEVARRVGAPFGVEVLVNETNRGLAETFMRATLAAAERAADQDIIVCMDSDNTHLPGQILQMMRNIQEGRDVVIASRYQYGAVVRGVPFHRRFLSRAMSILFQLVYPIPGVRDYSCGYRAYHAAFLKKAIAQMGEKLFYLEGFACMVGILLKLHKLGAICGEVPLVLRYDQKIGESKMRVGRTAFKTLVVLFKERFSA